MSTAYCESATVTGPPQELAAHMTQLCAFISNDLRLWGSLIFVFFLSYVTSSL